MPDACHQTGNACQKQEFQGISNDAEDGVDISNIYKTVAGAACCLLQIMSMTAIAAVPDIMGDKALGCHKPMTLNVPELRRRWRPGGRSSSPRCLQPTTGRPAV